MRGHSNELQILGEEAVQPMMEEKKLISASKKTPVKLTFQDTRGAGPTSIDQ